MAATPDTTPAEREDDVTPADDEALRHRVLGLARQITQLDTDEDVEVEDAGLAERLGHSLKPYVDRLVALRHLLNPVGRIIEKREKIEELREEIAGDIASVEDVSQDLGETVDASIVTELQTELAAVKRDRKLFAEADDEDEAEGDDLVDLDDGSDDDEDEEPEPQLRLSFLQRPVAERMRLVLGSRFIDPPRLATLLGGMLPDEDVEVAERQLELVWDGLMGIESFAHHARDEKLGPLRRALVDYVLLYRAPRLPVDGDGSTPTCIHSLKEAFGARFVSSSERNLWYARLPFYRETFAQGHWALVDKQYLNCTFKQPKIRLVMYARANDLPGNAVRQKSVLEDIYDRVIVDTALETEHFDNCNSLTRTSYQQTDEPSKKQVHVFYRDGHIRISGKRGVPHWRPGKPRWPGVLPSIVFDQG